ncbi:MAG: 30S ribosome-binding factor RbfA [Clostridiales bacterium]|nr:30S ribosome-binding factor RbfA [Clostridiales bacterium]
MKFDRNKRISEEIKKIVSHMIMYELKDPRVPHFTSITHVDTTKDLRFVNIYISFLEDNVDIVEAMKGLNKAKGYIRREIGKEIKMHFTPEPIFKLDESIKNAMHLEKIIKGLDIDHESDDDEKDNQ